MKTLLQQTVGVALATIGLAVAATQADVGPGGAEWRWTPIPEVVDAVPPLPPPSTFPVQLVLDDDNAEGSFGVAGQFSRQFLWFNRFTAGPGFHLEEVWVLFPSGANMSVGGAVQIAIYEDPDGDPTNGAALLSSFDTTIQAVDGNTFSIYPLATALTIPADSDVLIGVVPRFIVSGVTPPTTPAALDTSGSQSRSWLAIWSTDPPDPPALVPLPDQAMSLVDAFVPGGGNWMIRGFGTPQGTVEIPTLGGLGLAALALVLAAAALLVLRRRRRPAAARLTISLLLLALAGPAWAQTTIDNFTDNQLTLSDPPGGSSTTTGIAANIIGTRRGIVVKNLIGAGPTSAGVGSGALTLAVTATTPDSRGEARLSWDGDLLPLVLSPTGLGGVNLTAGSSTGLRIRVTSAGASAELEFSVYSSAANFSRAARLLPVIASAIDVFIPYSEFRIAGGTGADFTSVGAIELTVRGKEIAVVLDEIVTSVPVPAATKTAAQIPVDVDGDGRVDPGDRVRYTVTFTNTGNNAVNVDLTDTVDPNTTLVAASVSATPVARNDQYGWFGNVTLSADGSPFPTLLANDSDPDGDTVTVQSVTATSAQGGTVTLVSAATGEFTYDPPAGFKGVDSFSYTINDGEAHTSTATAYVNLEGIVWFVDNGCTVGCGAGTQASPFLTLPAAETPSGSNDIIYVRTGIAAYDTGPANGFTLDVDEQLLGEGVALVLGGTTIVPVGAPPTLTNNDGTPGRGLTLAGTGAGTDTVRGLTVGVTTAAKIFGSAFGTLATDTITLNGNGQALDLTNGILAATFASITSGSSAATGVTLNQVSGSLIATGGTTISASTTQGIFVHQSTVDTNFGNTSVTGTGTDRISLQNNSAGTRTFGTITTTGGTGVGFLHAVGGGATTVTGATSITDPSGIGISIATSTTAVSFAGTTINKGASSGTGLSITGSSGTTSFSNLAVTTSAGTGILMTGSTLSLAGTGSTVAATGGPALDLTTVTLTGGATFNTASSTGSTGKGMNLDTLTGFLTLNGGSIGTPTGIAFDLNAGSANVTYAGSISNVANAFLVEITGRTGGTVNLSGNLSSTTAGNGINVASNTGGTINFSGATKTLTTGADPAVTLATNPGATLNFTNGGLAITTTSGIGFNATGGATALTVQGTGNTITSTTGTALNVVSSSIGASGLTFQSISVDGNDSIPVNAIVLTSTGGSGGLTVTGTGGAGSGGTIRDTSGDAVILNASDKLSLTAMILTSNLGSGLRGTTVNGLVLDNCSVTANGDAVAVDESGIELINLTGTTSGGSNPTRIVNSTISNNFEFEIQITNTSGTLTDLQMSGNAISSDGATAQHGNLFNFLSAGGGTGNMTLNLTSGSFTGAAPATATGVQCDNSGSSGTVRCNISGATFTNNNVAVSVSQAQGGNLKFNVANNTATGNRSHGLNLFVAAIGTGTVDGSFLNNVVGTLGSAGSGSNLGFGIRVQNEGVNTSSPTNILISGNTVQEMTNFAGVNVNQGIAGQATSKTTNVTITNNTIQHVDNSRAIIVQQNNSTNVTSAGTTCADISGNEMNNIAGNVGDGTKIRFRKLDANGGVFNVRQLNTTDLAAANSPPNGAATTTTTVAQISIGGTPTFGAAACQQPVP